MLSHSINTLSTVLGLIISCNNLLSVLTFLTIDKLYFLFVFLIMVSSFVFSQCSYVYKKDDPLWTVAYLLQWQCWISWLMNHEGFPKHHHWTPKIPDPGLWKSAQFPHFLSPLHLFHGDFLPDTGPRLKSPTGIHGWRVPCHQTGYGAENTIYDYCICLKYSRE